MTNTTQHPSVAEDAKLRHLVESHARSVLVREELYREIIEHIDTLLAAARTEGAASKKPDLVPGKMHCARCNFSLLRNVLSMADGEVYAGTNETEPCPNGCGPLWPMTWEQEARDNYKLMDGLLARAEKAEAALAEASIPEAAKQNGGLVRAALIDLIAVEDCATNGARTLQTQQDVMVRFARASKALASTQPPAQAEARQQIPDGWQWVPKEPTDEMAFATTHVNNSLDRCDVIAMLRAAIAAAPAAPQQEVKGD